MIVYVTQNFFAMLSWEYSIKMPCNVCTHDLKKNELKREN